MIKSLKDLKIMLNIVEDARIPISSLAKKCRLKREVVQYRLKNLEKSIIAGYQARVNLLFLADSIYTIYLNIPGLERHEIISKLKKLPRVHWIGSTLGRWNYILAFSVNQENPLSKFLDEISKTFEKNQIRYKLTQQIEEFKDSFGGLFNKNLLLTSQKRTRKIELDEIDIKIIENLTKNARLSNSEIAEKVNMTREAVRMRIKNLEKTQVILNYRTLIKPQALELENFFLAIKYPGNLEDISKISTFLCNNKSVSYVCTTAGDFNIISVIHLKSIKELDEVCSKIRKEFPSVMLEIETLPLVGVDSQNYLP